MLKGKIHLRKRVLGWYNFLAPLQNSEKANIIFVMSVCPSVRMEQLGSHWTDFHEILYLNVFRQSVAKIQVFLTL